MAHVILTTLAVLLVVVDVAVAVVTLLAAQGIIGPNPYAGIRTRIVLATREAWTTGHRAAVPMLVVGAGTSALVALLSMVALGTAPTIVMLVLSLAVLVGFLLVGGAQANVAARGVLEREALAAIESEQRRKR